MKKKLLSTLLSLAILLTMMPATTQTASAVRGTVLTSSTTEPSSGSYYLNSDVVLPSKLNISSDAVVTLDLNGHTLSRNLPTATADGCVIDVQGQLTLIDSKGTGKITGGNNTRNGGGIHVNGPKSVLNMCGGTITGNKAQYGGGIYNEIEYKCILTGGVITGNEATIGGGIYVGNVECFAAGTMITMADGTKRAVETLNIGDEVRVFDHENGKVSTAPLFDAWKYPEKHSGVVTLHFTNDIDITVVGGHSFFSRSENKYVSVTGGNVNSFVGEEFYNVDNARWETLIGYDYIDGEVDTYVITSEKHLNCVANGMLSNEDGFYTTLTNIFEYGDNLKIDAAKKAADIDKYGLMDFKDTEYISEEVYDALNIKYMNVAFGKGLITPEEIEDLAEYWCGVDPELYCGTEEKTEKSTDKFELLASSGKKLLAASPSAIPTETGTYLGGTLQVVGNTAGNLYQSDSKKVTLGTKTSTVPGNGIDAPTGEFSVGVTTETAPVAGTPAQFTTSAESDEVKYFFSDNPAYYVNYNIAGHLELKVPEAGNYAVSIIPSEHGKVVASAKEASENATVTLTVTPDSGYEQDTLKVTDASGNSVTVNSNQFKMPARAVTVTATFKKNTSGGGSAGETTADPSVDPQKSTREIVLLKATTSGNKAVKLSWNSIDNASKYVVYAEKCGTNFKKIKTTTSKTYTVKKINGKKLKPHKAYKFYVAAYDAEGNKIKSRSVHFITANTKGKYANVKTIKAKYDELLLSVGITQKIGAKYKMYAGKKHLKKTHGASLCYTSNNTKVATVSQDGTVKAVGKGTATIYIQDVGGKYCKTRITVE